MPVATRRGGAELTLLHAVQSAADGVPWLVVFLEDGHLVRDLERLGAQTLVLPAGRVRDVGRLLAVVRHLVGALRAWRPDVVVSWMPKAHLYGSPAAAALRRPALWFQHGLPSATDAIDRLVALLPACGVLVPSHAVARAQAAVWPHRRTFVAYPGVDLAPSTDASGAPRRALLESLGIASDAPVVGLVARLQAWKGVHVLVDALPAVLARHPGAQAVVVGGDHPLEPGYRDDLVRRIERLGLTGRVHLVGHQAEAWRWMTEFDVVVHASDAEPFGIVVLEAMALGRPLVAGAAGGPAEIARDGDDAFLVEYGDTEALADRINRYLDDPQTAAEMGARAAATARSFTASRFRDEVLATLRSCAEGR